MGAMRRFVNLAAALVVLGVLVFGAFTAVRALTTPHDEDFGPGLVVDHGSLPSIPGRLNTPGAGDKVSFKPPVDATQWPVPPATTNPATGSPVPGPHPTGAAQVPTRIHPSHQTKAPVIPLPPSPAREETNGD